MVFEMVGVIVLDLVDVGWFVICIGEVVFVIVLLQVFVVGKLCCVSCMVVFGKIGIGGFDIVQIDLFDLYGVIQGDGLYVLIVQICVWLILNSKGLQVIILDKFVWYIWQIVIEEGGVVLVFGLEDGIVGWVNCDGFVVKMFYGDDWNLLDEVGG